MTTCQEPKTTLIGDRYVFNACTRRAGHDGDHYDEHTQTSWLANSAAPYDRETEYREEIAGLRVAIAALLPYVGDGDDTPTRAAARRFAGAVLKATERAE